MEFPETEIVKLILAGFRTLAILLASIVGIYGINSWRRETRWKRKYELAEEILALVYEAKENIAMIRQDFSWSSEGRTREKLENETVEETEIRNSAYVTIERANTVKETFYKLQSLKFRFAAVFNQRDTSFFDELIRTRNKLISSAFRLADARVRMLNKESNYVQESELIDKLEKVIWSDYEGQDEISLKVEKVVVEIEMICSTVIRKST
ncbi:MAG: hypothetical protein R8G66_34185 [Cytophagales bacterium]|nr:hypothetical protein [Cytophagales bacterium]